MKKKLLTIFMSLAIAVCFVPTFAFADPVEGDETEETIEEETAIAEEVPETPRLCHHQKVI